MPSYDIALNCGHSERIVSNASPAVHMYRTKCGECGQNASALGISLVPEPAKQHHEIVAQRMHPMVVEAGGPYSELAQSAGPQTAKVSNGKASAIRPPTLEEVTKAGYAEPVAASIVAEEQAAFDAGQKPYGPNERPAPKPEAAAKGAAKPEKK